MKKQKFKPGEPVDFRFWVSTLTGTIDSFDAGRNQYIIRVSTLYWVDEKDMATAKGWFHKSNKKATK